MPGARRQRGVEGLKATADLAKQLITLGSALITVTVTFADKFRENAASEAPLPPPPALGWAWVAYIVSIACAILTLMAVTGSLNEIDQTRTERRRGRVNSKIWGVPMLLSFLIGLGCTAIAGWNAAH